MFFYILFLSKKVLIEIWNILIFLNMSYLYVTQMSNWLNLWQLEILSIFCLQDQLFHSVHLIENNRQIDWVLLREDQKILSLGYDADINCCSLKRSLIIKTILGMWRHFLAHSLSPFVTFFHTHFLLHFHSITDYYFSI